MVEGGGDGGYYCVLEFTVLLFGFCKTILQETGINNCTYMLLLLLTVGVPFFS